MGDVAKWVARSVVKGVVIMTPAVPFFWITRTNQNKHRGLFIHPEQGMLTHKPEGTDKYYTTVEAGDVSHRPELVDKDVYFSQYNRSATQNNRSPFDNLGPMNAHTANPGAFPDRTDPNLAGYAGSKFHPYHEGNGLMDKAFNKIGGVQQTMAKQLTPAAKWGDANGGAMGSQIKDALGFQGDSFKRFTHPFARASMSYTPYMYAKAEFSTLWDNGKTDLAVERLVDGAAKLNWKEFKAGAGEVASAILHKPFEDPAREVEAHRRIKIDTSASEIFNEQEFSKQQKQELAAHEQEESKAVLVKKLEAEKFGKAPASSWRDRVVSGQKAEPAEEKLAAAKDAKYGVTKSASYSEQEAMRKALEELQPPTNSIN